MTRAVELSSTALVSMWQYYALLRQREGKPVMPIALVFYPGREGRIDLYLACLRRLIDAELAGTIDPARTFLLGNIVETYSPLSDAERDQLRVQLQEEGDTTYDNRTRIPTLSLGAVGRDCPPYAAHDRGRLAVPAR